MLLHLSTVEDVFELIGRGLIIVPGIPADSQWRDLVADHVTLERPDGSKLRARIKGRDMSGPKRLSTPLLIDSGLTKADVPVGTKLWIENRKISS